MSITTDAEMAIAARASAEALKMQFVYNPHTKRSGIDHRAEYLPVPRKRMLDAVEFLHRLRAEKLCVGICNTHCQKLFLRGRIIFSPVLNVPDNLSAVTFP